MSRGILILAVVLFLPLSSSRSDTLPREAYEWVRLGMTLEELQHGAGIAQVYLGGRRSDVEIITQNFVSVDKAEAVKELGFYIIAAGVMGEAVGVFYFMEDRVFLFNLAYRNKQQDPRYFHKLEAMLGPPTTENQLSVCWKDKATLVYYDKQRKVLHFADRNLLNRYASLASSKGIVVLEQILGIYGDELKSTPQSASGKELPRSVAGFKVGVAYPEMTAIVNQLKTDGKLKTDPDSITKALDVCLGDDLKNAKVWCYAAFRMDRGNYYVFHHTIATQRYQYGYGCFDVANLPNVKIAILQVYFKNGANEDFINSLHSSCGTPSVEREGIKIWQDNKTVVCFKENKFLAIGDTLLMGNMQSHLSQQYVEKLFDGGYLNCMLPSVRNPNTK